MTKTLNSTKFVPGQDVACYSGVVLAFGEVLSVEDGKAKVAINVSTGFNESEIRIFEYVSRESDGLFVAPECVSERVPTRMIADTNDIGPMNKWRYFPNPIEKMKRKFFS